MCLYYHEKNLKHGHKIKIMQFQANIDFESNLGKNKQTIWAYTLSLKYKSTANSKAGGFR